MATVYSTFWVYVNRGPGLRDGGSLINGRSPQSVATELGISIFSSATGTGEGHRPDEYIEITSPSNMFPKFNEAQGTYFANDPSPNSGLVYAGAPHEATTYIWVGVLRIHEYTPPGVPPLPPGVPPGDPPAPPTPPAPATKRRRWIDGFELSDNGEAATGVSSTPFSRDASRVPDGFGFALRQPGGATNVSHTLNTLGTSGLPSRRSWERLYIRIRVLPAANAPIWRAHGSVSSASGVELYLTPTGTLKAYNILADGSLGVVLGETAALTVNRWTRLDLLVAFGAVSPDYAFQVAVNALIVLQTAATGSDGVLGVQYHQSSTVGTERSGASTIECDFDDWINADFPVYFGYNGDDWSRGSHVRRAQITGFGPTHAADWVGNFRTGLPNPVRFTPTQDTVYIAATVASAILDAVLAAPQMDGKPVAAALVAVYNVTGGGTAQVGYNINAAGNVLSSVASAAASWMRKLYTTIVNPAPEISTLTLIHVKDPAAAQRTIAGIHAVVELVGEWGPEDTQSLTDLIFPGTISHNNPYPQLAYDTPVSLVPVTPGATTTTGPQVFVALESGIYTGNDLGQDIPLKYPSHWVWIRPLTGDTGGARWWTSMLAAHKLLYRGCSAAQMPQAVYVDAANAKLRIAANDTQANATGVVYQWMSVSDVGMRYLYNGAARGKDSVASYSVTFPDTGFTPDVAFAWPEQQDNDSTNSLRFKGPAHAADAATLLNTASTTIETDCLSMAAAALTLRTSLNISGIQQVAYSTWRETDGAATGAKLFDVTSYVGDGTASRDIALTLGVNWPLWVLVVPHSNGAASYQRDPSHTGVNSTQIAGTNSTTAITAGGVDKITVGITLNTNAVTYSVFALRGHPDGWYNGAAIVLPPAAAPGSQFVLTLPAATPDPGSGAGGGTSLADIRACLRDRYTNDPFWSVTEANDAINEALRYFNLFTGYWRGTATAVTNVGDPFVAVPGSLTYRTRVTTPGRVLTRKSIVELYRTRRNWRTQTTASGGAVPTTIREWAPVGLGTIAIWPTDAVGGTTVTFEAVKLTPILVSDSQLLDIGNEELDLILAESLWILSFKRPSILAQMKPKHQIFLQGCLDRNDQLRASSYYRQVLGLDQAQRVVARVRKTDEDGA